MAEWTDLQEWCRTHHHQPTDPIREGYWSCACRGFTYSRTGPFGVSAETEPADPEHAPTEIANMSGGYDCKCGEPWLTDRCSVDPECECWPTDPSQQFNYYGATEPGSAMEWNPRCPVHRPSGPAEPVTEEQR